VIQPLLPVERTVERAPGCWPCQALAAEGGGRQARLYKGQASPATIATGGPMGCGSRPCASAKPLAARYITHSKFNRAFKIVIDGGHDIDRVLESLSVTKQEHQLSHLNRFVSLGAFARSHAIILFLQCPWARCRNY